MTNNPLLFGDGVEEQANKRQEAAPQHQVHQE